AKNYLVAQKRRPPGTDIEATEAEQYDSAGSLREYASPERIALKDEIAGVVLKAIDELPDDLKTAIILRELEGMSYDEISDAMSCPIGTVRSRIFRAREAIDKLLDPLLND
ncbi:MAG: sigma-70 family RNA polymerase sigma factor, partial [Thiohalomonadales bacterium]